MTESATFLLAPMAVLLIGVVIALRAGNDEESRIRPLVAGILLLLPAAGLLLWGQVGAGLSLALLDSMLLGLGAALLLERPPQRDSAEDDGSLVRRRRAARKIARLGMLVYVLVPALSTHWILLQKGLDERQANAVIRYLLVGWVYGMAVGILGGPAGQSLRSALDFVLAPLCVVAIDALLLRRAEPLDALLLLALTYLVAAFVGFFLVGWLSLTEGGRSRRSVALFVVSALLLLPAMLTFGAARLLFEEAVRRGVLTIDLRGLAPIAVAVVWVAIEVVQGFRGRGRWLAASSVDS